MAQLKFFGAKFAHHLITDGVQRYFMFRASLNVGFYPNFLFGLVTFSFIVQEVSVF